MCIRDRIAEGETTHVVLGGGDQDPVRVLGTITAAGEPVEAEVTLMPAEGGFPAWTDSVEADSDGLGQFTLELEGPGRYAVYVDVPGREMGPREQVVDVPAVDEYELAVELFTGAIAGRVYDQDGEPLANADVNLSIDGSQGSLDFRSGPFQDVSTEDDGSYEFSFLEPGTYTVQAGSDSMTFFTGAAGKYGRQRISGLVVGENERREGVDFHLDEPLAIHGTVVDPQGLPVQDAHVFVHDAGGAVFDRFSSARSDSTGQFRYQGLSEGSYTLFARSRNRASRVSPRIDVRAGAGPPEVKLVLLQSTTLLVSVRLEDQDETAAPGYKLLVTDDAGRQLNGLLSIDSMMEAFQSSGSQEVRRVGPVAPGTYRARVTLDDGRVLERTLEAAGEKELPVEIVVEPE